MLSWPDDVDVYKITFPLHAHGLRRDKRDGTFWISDHAVNALEKHLATERQKTTSMMREMGVAV